MQCTTVLFMERTANAIIFFFAVWAAIWLGYKFITNEDIQQELMQSKYKTYYNIGKLYFVSIILTFGTYAIYAMYTCFHPRTSSILRMLAVTLYGIEHEILIFLLFYRIQLAFDDSILQLTSCNVWLFRVVFTIYVLTIIVLIFFTSALYTPFGALLILVIWILQFVLIFWITVIFLYKLRVISFIFTPHSEEEEAVFNGQMLLITTKMALLTVLAITPNFVVAAIRFYAGYVQSHEIDFVILCGNVADVLSNFVAILLAFKSYEAQYMKACGCCHRSCTRCWSGVETYTDYTVTSTTGNTITPLDTTTYLAIDTRTNTSAFNTITTVSAASHDHCLNIDK